LWTIKDIQFDISATQIFMDNLTSDSDSDTPKMSKKHVFRRFPQGFGLAKFFGKKIQKFGHVSAKFGTITKSACTPAG
jgi:hypothetical protein